MKLIYFVFITWHVSVISSVYLGDQYPANSGFKNREPGSETYTVTLDDRLYCADGDPVPSNRHDTLLRVNNLIASMDNVGYDAYIVPTADEHQNEYVADSDKRREYISGFTGSAGTAVILRNETRALWTDGRYFLQADEELDCYWLLMKEEESGVPSIAEWLIENIPGGNVGADARLLGADIWIETEAILTENGITVTADDIQNGNDLLDLIWNNDDRPASINNQIYEHELQYAGQPWQEKVVNVMAEVEGYGAEAFIVTALDEIAWLFNLRGSDIPYNPVFQSYVIIDGTSRSPPFVTMYIDGEFSINANTSLGIDNCVAEYPCVSTAPYDDIGDGIINLKSRTDVNKIMISSAYSYSLGSSFYIYDLVGEDKRISKPSPILFMKAKKNEVEQDGMRKAHFRDATALIRYLAFMDNEISQGNVWTEMTAQDQLAQYRYDEPLNMGLSFDTISAYGANAAIIHYSASDETDTIISNDNVYLVDSGGQYEDGTTDVTRTVHFGIPTAKQIEAYTRVLMGVIDFASIIIPEGTGKYYTDVLARRSLYDVGLDYKHGTSHGVGMFLYVHESSADVYELGFCGSDEPGYYEDGNFGIRIENVIMVVNTTTEYNFNPVSYAFETLTLVPYEKKLIDTSLLSDAQCQVLTDYNIKIRSEMGPILQSADPLAYAYMQEKTNISC